MRFPTLILVLALAGCGSTPRQVLEAGRSSEAALKAAPAAAADCIARNGEEISSGMSARIRPLEGGREVLVQSSTEALGTLAVVQVLGASSGSRARIFLNPQVATGNDLPERLLAGC